MSRDRWIDPACPIRWDFGLNRGLVARWRRVPNAGWSGGLTFRDLVRGGHAAHDGTLTGGAAWSGPKGRTGGDGAVSFDGVDDYVDCGNLPLDSSNWTIACWMTLLGGAGSPHRCIAWHGQGPTIYRNAGTTGSIAIAHGGSIDLSPADGAANSVQVGETAHVVITRSGSNAAIYKNGVLTGSSSSFSVTYTADSSFRIGNSTSFGENVNALLDDIMAFSRGLAAVEVAALCDQGRRGDAESLRWLRGAVVLVPAVSGPPPAGVSQGAYAEFAYAEAELVTAAGSTTLILSPLGAQVAIAGPTVVVADTILPAALVAQGAVVGPLVAVGSAVAAGPLVAAGTPVGPSVLVGERMLPAPLAASGVLVSPTVLTGNTLAVGPLAASGILTTSVVTVGTVLTPGPLAAAAALVGPVVRVGTTLAPAPVAAQAIVVGPAAATGWRVDLSALPAGGTLVPPLAAVVSGLAFSPLAASVTPAPVVVAVGLEVLTVPVAASGAFASPLVAAGQQVAPGPLVVQLVPVATAVQVGIEVSFSALPIRATLVAALVSEHAAERPVVRDAVVFRYLRAEAVEFRYRRSDALAFRYRRADALAF